MLTVRLLCVGRLGEPFWKDAVQEYEKRLGAYCKLERIVLPEQKLPQSPSASAISAALEKEGSIMLAKRLPSTTTVALCIEGKEMSSEQFAAWLERLTVTGVSRIDFLVGGSYGLAESVKRQADYRQSLSPMTLPHSLAQVMLLEQLYRAMNILTGGKYHK